MRMFVRLEAVVPQQQQQQQRQQRQQKLLHQQHLRELFKLGLISTLL